MSPNTQAPTKAFASQKTRRTARSSARPSTTCSMSPPPPVTRVATPNIAATPASTADASIPTHALPSDQSFSPGPRTPVSPQPAGSNTSANAIVPALQAKPSYAAALRQPAASNAAGHTPGNQLTLPSTDWVSGPFKEVKYSRKQGESELLTHKQVLDETKKLKSIRVAKEDIRGYAQLAQSDKVVDWTEPAKDMLRRGDPSKKDEVIAIAYMCHCMFPTSQIWIVAPVHEYTKGGTVKTVPHITIKGEPGNEEQRLHATYTVEKGDLILHWLTKLDLYTMQYRVAQPTYQAPRLEAPAKPHSQTH